MIKTVTRAPKEYPEQGFSQCGAYSVRAILDAYGKELVDDPNEYFPHLWGVRIPFLTGSRTWARVLSSHKVPAKRGNARRKSDEQRIALLKKCMDDDLVVMLRIGDGYLQGQHISWIASLRGHWVTVWGYNDEEKVFYLYDSLVSPERRDTTAPIGNTKRTYAEMTRDWGAGFPFIWRYAYIKAG